MSDTSGTIRVTLADAPTDVLVYLVDHGPTDIGTIVDAVAPSGADDALGSVNGAISLLLQLGYVSIGPKAHAGWLWSATGDGVRAVAEARGHETEDDT